MADSRTYRSGEKAPESGLYASGAVTVALTRGERFPPRPGSGGWHLVHPASARRLVEAAGRSYPQQEVDVLVRVIGRLSKALGDVVADAREDHGYYVIRPAVLVRAQAVLESGGLRDGE